MTTPWKPPPPPPKRSGREVAGCIAAASLTDAEIDELREAFRSDAGRPFVLDMSQLHYQPDGVLDLRPSHRWDGDRWVPRRVWRDLPDMAARFAAPWWALAWLLTGGRMGAPLWRWNRDPGQVARLREWTPATPPLCCLDLEHGQRCPLCGRYRAWSEEFFK